MTLSMVGSVRTRVFPAGLFVVSLVIGGCLSSVVYRIESQVEIARLARLADLVTSRIQGRIDKQQSILTATARWIEAERLSAPTDNFGSYVAGLGLAREFAGLQGVGFAPALPHNDDAALRAELARSLGLYGQSVALTPAESGQSWRAPVIILEPHDARNAHALGFDMFSEPNRRAAILAAASSGEPRATAPVRLVQEISAVKQAGFLIYVPLRRPDGRALPGGAADDPMRRVSGFVYAPFRAGDFHDAVLDGAAALPVHVVARDRAAPDLVLFDGGDPVPEDAHTAQRGVRVGGRDWQLVIAETGKSGAPAHLASALLAVLSVLLSAALAALWRNHQFALIEAEERARLAHRTAEDRSLLLREMAHRIKNHLARIQAIARQTQRESADMDEFGTRFGARIKAMAAAQDLLSAGGGARLRQMALRELGQIMPAAQAEAAVHGEDIELSPRQAQAMALVLHELATNAMKYADTTGIARLSLGWRVEPHAGGAWFQAEWFEPGAVGPAISDRRGFGTELLEAMVEGDLEGRLIRSFTEDGMHVAIGFPMHPARA